MAGSAERLEVKSSSWKEGEIMSTSAVLGVFSQIVNMFQVPLGIILGVVAAAISIRWVIKVFSS